MRLFGLLACACVGCFSPRLQVGSPCDVGPCPSGLVCSPDTRTCQLTAIDAASRTDAPLIDAPPDARVLIDGCTPSGPEICGDGIDQDCDGSDATCPVNDRPAGARDISLGGTYSDELAAAHHDLAGSCYLGHDVFYKLTLTAPQVVYLDTFGSSFDAVIQVFPGATCAGLGSGGSGSCIDDTCGGLQAQTATQLPAGESCIAVAQGPSTETTGTLHLNVKLTGRTGRQAPAFAAGDSAVTGNTCTTSSTKASASCAGATMLPADEWFFPICPGGSLIDGRDCAATWDSLFYVLDPSRAEVACNDDSTAADCMPNQGPSEVANVPVAGPGVAWFGVSGYNTGDCGAYNFSIHLH